MEQKPEGSEKPTGSEPSKGRRAAGALVLLLVLLGGVFAMNWVDLKSPAADAIDADPRNAGFKVSVHYANWVDRSTIVFDLRETPAEFAPAEAFRVFLQFADACSGLDVDKVEFARSGDVRFVLSGADFKTAGLEYGEQNPMYTLRTFPEKLLRPDGSTAFEGWEGGELAVAGKQIEDFKAFITAWAAVGG